MTQCSLETLQAIRLKAMEILPVAAIVIDAGRIIIDMNEEAEFRFGYARGDLLGKLIETLMPEEYREAHVGHITNFFRSPRRREMGSGLKLEGLHRGGEKFPVHIMLAPISIEGQDGGIFGLAVIRRAD